MAGNIVGYDDLVPPQNNGTLVYRLTDSQWFFIPHVEATCWEVLKTTGDLNELYRGNYHNSILQEDITEGDNETIGDSGQVPTSEGAGSGSDNIKCYLDGTTNWAVDEWVGGTMYFQRAGEEDIQSAEVDSNTANVLTGKAGTFQVNGEGELNGWTGDDDPDEYDYWCVIRENLNQPMQLYYKSPKMALGEIKRLKQFVEILVRTYVTGTLKIVWSTDDGISDVMQFDLDQGDTFWGSHYFGAYNVDPNITDKKTLLWQRVDQRMLEMNFNASAEGKYIQFEIALNTANKFDISLLAFGFMTHGGAGWVR